MTPRLCALVAYYPSVIPDPARTRFPMQTTVLIHLVGNEIGVNKTPEVLGIQGKRKTVRKRVEAGVGLGGKMRLDFCQVYKYEGLESGFAEHDLDEYDAVGTGLAWSRSLEIVRRAFGMRVDIERIRDQHVERKQHLHEWQHIMTTVLTQLSQIRIEVMEKRLSR